MGPFLFDDYLVIIYVYLRGGQREETCEPTNILINMVESK